MFSVLDLINQYLGYFNMNTKVKNRIYNIAGTLGVIYLFYVGIRFVANQYLLRGILILLLAILLTYYLYLNFYFFFTNKQAPFDISPRLEKILKLKPKEEVPLNQNRFDRGIQNARVGDLDGHFPSRHVLPAKISSDPDDLLSIQALAQDMVEQHLLQTNYQGVSDQQLIRRLKQNGNQPAFAIGKGALIPYFTIKDEGNQYVAYAGINPSKCYRVGTLMTLGLQSMSEVRSQHVKIYPASLILRGGEYKTLGRNHVMIEHNNYVVRPRIAVKKEAK